MDVTDVVDEQSQSEGLLLLIAQVSELLLNCGVNEARLVISRVREPVNQRDYGLINRVGILNESWEIMDTTALIEVWSVNEVPSALP